MLLIIFVVHSQIAIYFCNICINVLNRSTPKHCSAEHHRGKLCGSQCSSQVKETPWSLSYLTLCYIAGTSVGKDIWTKLYSIALTENLYGMSYLITNCKWKTKSQERGFLAVLFALIHVLWQYAEELNVTASLIIQQKIRHFSKQELGHFLSLQICQ